MVIKYFVCLFVSVSLSLSLTQSLVLAAPRSSLREAFASFLSQHSIEKLYFLPLDHIPAKSGSQIASAAHSYCKQFIRNFPSDCF